jgi:hypothetical protein
MRAVGVIGIVLFALCGTAGAVAIADDFESGDLSKWSLDIFNNWGQVVEWDLVHDGTQVWEGSGGFPPPGGGGGNSVQYLTGFNAADVSVTAKVKTASIINGGSWSGIVARYTDPRHFYVLGMSADSLTNEDQLVIAKSDDLTTPQGWVGVDLLASTTLPQNELGLWNTLRLDVTDNHLMAYVNGDLYLNTYDSSLTSGSVGLTNAGAVTRFDNFAVTGSTVPLPGVLLLGSMGIGLVGRLRRRRTL